MSLKEYKNYFKETFGWKDTITIGKIDNSQEKAICFYNSKTGLGYRGTIGGRKNQSTSLKAITILLRYSKNQDEAEKMAQSIYEFFDGRTFYIDNKRIFTQMDYECPIDLGTDDENVYEYSIELKFYEEKVRS